MHFRKQNTVIDFVFHIVKVCNSLPLSYKLYFSAQHGSGELPGWLSPGFSSVMLHWQVDSIHFESLCLYHFSVLYGWSWERPTLSAKFLTLKTIFLLANPSPFSCPFIHGLLSRYGRSYLSPGYIPKEQWHFFKKLALTNRNHNFMTEFNVMNEFMMTEIFFF